MEAAIGETRYLLDRWRFFVSDRGCIWIQPTGGALSPEELAGFFTLLHRSCDEAFPRVLLLDLSRIDVVGSQYSLLLALTKDFAGAIGAKCRVIAGADRPVSAACLYKHEHV
jgi:hypothetical protein